MAQPFTLGGFAIDLASASGSGVESVYVVAYPTNGTPPIAVGAAMYGISVPEVGTFFGDARFAASGFQITVSELPPGQYDLVSFAYSTVAAAFNNASVVRVDVDTPVPAPEISLPAGTYTTPQSVTITIPSDAEVRITRDGTTPLLTSESYSGGVLTVSVNTSLRARAFRAGWAPSPTVAADYTLVGAAPTILTAGGQYEAPVVVQISVPEGAVVRVTRDGSTPTSTSEEYGAPFEISQNTQLRAVAFKAGMAPSLTVGADYTFAAAIPTFSVPAGTYTGSISVALASATPGASLHWTLDGSDPTTSSAAYATPIVIAAGATKTLKARAFRTGWTPSTVADAVYIFELTGPVTISAQTSPAPNSAGWNNSDVTVTFTCTNVSSCPAPVSVTTEGASQVVTRTASNSDHTAQATVTLNIDRTAPTVALPSTLPPASGGSLALAGASNDTLSGVDSVLCNGVPATVASGSVTCTVPVKYGTNALVMHAVDLAGNSATSATHFAAGGTPALLDLSPSRRALTVGQVATLRARDDGDQTPESISWSTSDAAVASVTADGTVTANAIGSATVTAASGTLAAQLRVDVLPAGVLPAGTMKWSTDAWPGYTATVTPVSTSDGTAFMKVEKFRDGSVGAFGAVTHTVLRGLTDDGETTFSLHAGLGVGEVVVKTIGDVLGGVLLVVRKDPLSQAEMDYDGANGGRLYTLVRTGLLPGSPIWRYPLGRWEAHNEEGVASLAQAHDGTIFGRANFGSELFALDGFTGQLRFRQTGPRWVHHYTSERCPELNFDQGGLAGFTAPRIDGNGLVGILAASSEGHSPLVVTEFGVCRVLSIGSGTVTTTLNLYRIGTSGSTQVMQLAQLTKFGGEAQVLPDDAGGVLASWRSCNGPCEVRGRHVVDSIAGPEFSVSGGSPTLSGPGQIGFGPNGAISLVNGTALWSTAQWSFPAVALEGGGAIYGNPGAPSTLYGPDGSLQATNLPAFFSTTGTAYSPAPAVLNGNTWFGWNVQDWSTSDVRFGAVVASSAFASRFAFSLQEGDERGSRAVTIQGTGIFAKGHDAFQEIAFHVGIWMVPTDQRRWSSPVPGDPVCTEANSSSAPSCFRSAAPPSGVNIAAGHKFATIDGRPSSSIPIGGFLNSVINSSGAQTLSAVDFELLHYPRNKENQIIRELFALRNNFPENTVPYVLSPVEGSGEYNSNSFAATLLALSGVSRPLFPVTVQAS